MVSKEFSLVVRGGTEYFRHGMVNAVEPSIIQNLCLYKESLAINGTQMQGYSCRSFCRLMACKSVGRVLSVACLSVTFVDCGKTAIGGVIISLQADRASTWPHQALNSIKIGIAVFEHWRT